MTKKIPTTTSSKVINANQNSKGKEKNQKEPWCPKQKEPKKSWGVGKTISTKAQSTKEGNRLLSIHITRRCNKV
jgi:hypothetical protein